MRILFAAKYVPIGPRPMGGVQSWIATMRAELERLGNVCEEWQPGMPRVRGRFDLGIVANAPLTWPVSEVCRSVVNVSHGIIPEERPAAKADVRIFVSEGVRDHWGLTGAILRQPIDLDAWRPDPSRNRREVIRFSYRRTPTLCPEVAGVLGLPYRHVHKARPLEARVALAGAGLVFASGRAALEAMACGAPTVIYDHRASYQGPLMDTDLGQQIANSYSGRGGITPSLADLVEASRSTMMRPEGSWRDWVAARHDVRVIAAELLAQVGVSA